MRKVVLDTNCLLMSLTKNSQYHAIWTSYLNEEYILCVTNEIISEYEEILSQKASPEFAELIITIILSGKNILRVNPAFRTNLIFLDPDDNKFVDCAFTANADYIVSQDSHFDVLKHIDFPKIKVIKIDDFMRDLAE
jgi:putative PIN family toxin of toxin-antitoxin system